MKNYVDRNRTYRECKSIECDMCGKKHAGDEWGDDYYDVLKTAVKIREGDRYPDGGFETDLVFDICPECFRNKLVPWLAEQGAEPRTEEFESWW